MDYFFYCRDKPGAAARRKALLPEHWAFMEGYAGQMIARGPTMSEDGRTVTGSMHIVDLPDVEAARVFAYDEPLAKAELFDDIWYAPWRNVLGRTMWDFAGRNPQSRFLAIGLAGATTPSPEPVRQRAFTEYWSAGDTTGQCILFGPLLAPDGATWCGAVALLECQGRAGAEALAATDPLAHADFYAETQVHRWRFGGAENLQDLVSGD